jgi:SAM-dependent methyltransferase
MPYANDFWLGGWSVSREPLRERSWVMTEKFPKAQAAPQVLANATIREQVRDYYGSVLKSSGDLKTSACCCGADARPREVREALSLIADEILERFYGCGSPLPPVLEGLTVLDLGCGSGQDSYIAAWLVGESGRVIGVDMTSEQIEIAQRHEDEQARRFGYAKPNTRFIEGYIEDLEALGIASASVDVVISNCVINLSPAKEQVFREIYRVLKPGGELYFSDVFADRRIPAWIQEDPVVRGECLGGALYHEDFRRLMNRAGWADFRVVTAASIAIDAPKLMEMLAGIAFESRTIRAIKCDLLEDCCEQYGQVAQYTGGIPYYESVFRLDRSHVFNAGVPQAVCGNTAAMLQETRYAPHFLVTGDRSTHYGLFPGCGDSTTDGGDTGAPTACC